MNTTRQPDHPIHPMFIQRWSPRAFNGEPITQDALFTVLEAARWAPSAFNAQPWRFVWALRDTEAWLPIFDCLVPGNQVWAQRASALLVIVSRTDAVFPGKDAPSPNRWHSFDSGAAWASLAFQASMMDLAAHAMAGFDADRLRNAIAVLDGHFVEAVVAIGKAGDKGVLPEALQAREAPNGRLPLNQLASMGRF